MHLLQGAAVGNGATAIPFRTEDALEVWFRLLLIQGLNSTFALLGLRAGPRQTLRSCSFPRSRQSWRCPEHFQDPFVLMLSSDFVPSSAPVLGPGSS